MTKIKKTLKDADIIFPLDQITDSDRQAFAEQQERLKNLPPLPKAKIYGDIGGEFKTLD
jgi:hypothetical protein